MTAWLRWLSDRAAIGSIRHDTMVPGMVTLAWHTPEPAATVVETTAGSVLYTDPTPDTDHRVTLAGGPGTSMAVHIRAGQHQRRVQLSF